KCWERSCSKLRRPHGRRRWIMAMKRRLVTLAKGLAALTLVAGVGIAIALYVMGHRDAQHARFYNTGKSINSFLSDYSHAVREAFQKRNADAVASLYSDSYFSPGRGRWETQQDKSQSDVSVFRLAAHGQEDFNKSNLRDEIARYVGGITSIDDIKCKIDRIENVELERSAVLTVKFILDGTDQAGSVFKDRHFYRWYLANEGRDGYDWKIVKDELVEGIRVAGDGRGFRELDPAAIGIDFKHERDPKLNIKSPDVHLKFGVMEHGFGGVSAVDYNNDGLPDIFFSDGKRCRLYRNNGVAETGGVTFKDATKEA